MKSPSLLAHVSNPLTVLRLMCGLFYLPHVLFKLHDLHGSLAFFSKAGFNPSWFFLLMALLMEGACFLGLTFNILVKWAGLISAAVMANAIIAVFNTKGIGWLWNLGGIEYLVFWGVSSLALAVHGWRQEWLEHGRVGWLAPSAQGTLGTP